MKRTTLLTWLLVTVSTASLTACGWTSRTKAEAWLEELPLASAQVDTSGKWIELSGGLTPYVDPYTDSGYSYGPSRMLISQRGNRLFGTFRDFEIIGAVDRDKVYVVAIAEGRGLLQHAPAVRRQDGGPFRPHLRRVPRDRRRPLPGNYFGEISLRTNTTGAFPCSFS